MAKFTRSNNAILPDGDRVWDDNQDMDIHRIVNAQNAVDPQDYITKAQTYPRITEDDATGGIYTIYVNWTTGTTDVEAVGGGTIGTPFKTPHLAFEWLDNYSIDPVVTVQIQCAADIYTLTETLEITHPQGQQIQILGERYFGTIDPLYAASVGGSLRNLIVGFDVSSWDETPIAGQFALFHNVSGSNSSVYNGGYEVQAGAGSGEFDFAFKGYPVIFGGDPAEPLFAPATAGINGDITFIKTVFIFDVGANNAISMNNGTTLGLINRVVIRQTLANEYQGNGISTDNASSFVIGGNVVLAGWNKGIYLRYGSVLGHVTGGYSSITNCQTGIRGDYGSVIDAEGMAITNCQLGIVGTDNTAVNALSTHITNHYKGIDIANNSSCEAAQMKNKYNSYGVYLWHGSNFRVSDNAGTWIMNCYENGIHMRYGNTCHLYDTTLDNSDHTDIAPYDVRMFFNNTLRILQSNGDSTYGINWVDDNSGPGADFTVISTTGHFYTQQGQDAVTGSGFDIISIGL